MAWTESGLFYATLRDALENVIALDWHATTIKIALTTNSDTPPFQTDPATWAGTNEVYGTGWAQGGVALSAAAAGATSTAPAITVTGSAPTTTLKYAMGNVSVATTTLTNARGAYLIADALSPKANIVAIYFGGSDYSTVAGTFAITWAGGGVVTFALAA